VGVDHDFEPAEGLEIRKVARGTKNMAIGPAMTREEAEQAVLVGVEMVEKYKEGLDIIGTGDMGIGNTTPSSAIVSVITGSEPELVTGRGTGIDDASLKGKVAVIKKAIAANRPDRRRHDVLLRSADSRSPPARAVCWARRVIVIPSSSTGSSRPQARLLPLN
jgi:nicotinate-nucleotide--dimethylbenzimidazole phosphoribosyltransferase